MAIRLFLAMVVLIGIMWLLSKCRRMSPAKRKNVVKSVLLYGVGIAILALVVTGKIPWLFALISAAVPWLNRFYVLKQAWKFFATVRNPDANYRQHSQTHRKPATSNMSITEAYEVLGLTPDANSHAIIEAHRKLMHKNHPDRGGSDYLATRINQAKETLLNAS